MTKSKLVIYILLILFGFGMFSYLDYINIMLFYDDAYTMAMVRHPFMDIYHITSYDVHPPLYYWMLKIFTSVFGDTIFVERMFSNFGVLAVMLFAATAIRKRFEDKVALTFIVLLILFPVSQYLATEVRMYSWAMFFALACAVFAYDVYANGKPADWMKFLLAALLASYTHYYALVTVFWIFIILFIVLFLRIKQRRKSFIVINVAFVLLYLPWIVNLIWQVRKVRHMFWVEPITFNDIFYHIYYFYSVKKEWLPFSDNVQTILMYGATLIIAIQAILLAVAFVKGYKSRNKILLFAMLSFIVFLLPVVTGFILSFTFRPIIVPRYMTCSFGLLLLSLSIVVVRSFDSKKLRLLGISSLVLLAFYGGMRYYGGVKYYKSERQAYNDIYFFINTDKNDPHVFLSEYFATSAMSRLNIFYPDSKYYVLIPEGWNDNFIPFEFNKVHHNQKFEEEFILVQKRHDEGGELGASFKEALEKNYMSTDSIEGLDMVLYKMKARVFTVPEE